MLVLLWKTINAMNKALGTYVRADDRQRHDAMRIVTQMAEKLQNEPKWISNIHADERDRQSRYDTQITDHELKTEAEPQNIDIPQREKDSGRSVAADIVEATEI